MGTTVTALLLSGEQLGLMHVGDSRAYLLRDDTLTQLTKDDTFVQSLVDQGLLTIAEARVHPRRSIVTQAIQGMEFQSTTSLLQAKPGDRLLICSDGLSDALDDDQIWQVLRVRRRPGRLRRAPGRHGAQRGGERQRHRRGGRRGGRQRRGPVLTRTRAFARPGDPLGG